MPIHSIYYSSLLSFCPFSLLSAKQGFVFRAPNGRRRIYFQPSASRLTSSVVFNLHAETETERRNPIAVMHAVLREESFRNLVKQRDSGKQGSNLSIVAKLDHWSKASEETSEQKKEKPSTVHPWLQHCIKVQIPLLLSSHLPTVHLSTSMDRSSIHSWVGGGL